MKNYIIYVLLIAIGLMFIALKFKGCKEDPPKQVATPVTERNAKPEDNKGLPAGEKAKSVIDLPAVGDPHQLPAPGKERKSKLVKTESGKEFLSYEDVSKFGFYFQTKFYTGFNGRITAGIAQEFFVYDRYSANVLIGFPSIGLGIEGLITRNFGLLGGATWDYLDYDNIGNFDTYKEGSFTARPIVGILFNF